MTLAHGATTHALVGIVDPGVILASRCGPVTAAGLRVYPPNQERSQTQGRNIQDLGAAGAGPGSGTS